MGLFDKKSDISRPELREALRKAPSSIPESGGKFIPLKERTEMEKMAFPEEKWGKYVSKPEFERRIKQMEKVDKFKIPAGPQRIAFEQKIEWLKKNLGGS